MKISFRCDNCNEMTEIHKPRISCAKNDLDFAVCSSCEWPRDPDTFFACLLPRCWMCTMPLEKGNGRMGLCQKHYKWFMKARKAENIHLVRRQQRAKELYFRFGVVVRKRE